MIQEMQHLITGEIRQAKPCQFTPYTGGDEQQKKSQCIPVTSECCCLHTLLTLQVILEEGM
jgi:hypothetical protein